MKSANPYRTRAALYQFLLKHGFILVKSDFGETTSRRFIHCIIHKVGKSKLFFGKIARTPELAKNLERELALGRSLQNLPHKIGMIVPVERISPDVFLYPFIRTQRLSDYFDRCRGRLPSELQALLGQRAVSFCYAQRSIRYRPQSRRIPPRGEARLVRLARRRPIYRRAELLKLQKQLDRTSRNYHFEVGDLQLQNMFWDSKNKALVLFDLEAWGEYRAHWSLASLFAISWFRHQGEQFSRELFHTFIADKRTTAAELHSFLLCCVYFVFIYYPKYSRRGQRYRKNFRRLVNWIVEVGSTLEKGERF